MSNHSQVAMFRWVVQRDLMLAWRRRTDVLASFVFFVIVVTLFPLSTAPEARLLRSIAPGVVWVAALLSSTISLGRLFANDYADGTLEQMLLTPQPLYLIVLGKLLAQWLISGLPLVLVAPLLGVQFGLEHKAPLALAAALTVGVPVLGLIGSIGAALTLGLRGGGGLISLLVLPLCIPVLVFGAAASNVASSSSQASIDLLAAVLALTLVFAPWTTAAALRISLE